MSLVGPRPVRRPRGRPDHRLGRPPARHHARHHRPLAGARPQRHPVRGDGEARLPLRDQLVALVGHEDPVPDRSRWSSRAGGRTDARSSWSRPSTRRPTCRACSSTSRRGPSCGRGGRVIVVDDGSTDDTAALVATLRRAAAGRGRPPGPQPGPRPGVRPRLPRGARALRRRRRPDRHARGRHDERPRRARADAGPRPRGRRRRPRLAARRRGPRGRRPPPRRALARRVLRDAPRRAGSTRAPSRSFFRVYRAAILRRGYERHGDARSSASAASPARPRSWSSSTASAPASRRSRSTSTGRSREGESKMRVLPTMGGYARLMARQRRRPPGARPHDPAERRHRRRRPARPGRPRYACSRPAWR